MGGYLEEAIGFLEGETDGCVNTVARSDLDQAGELQAEFGEKLRKLAAAHWLINKSAAEFLRGVNLAASCRLEFVKRTGSTEHYFYSVNSADSMENAVICGDKPLVSELAEASLASSHQHGHITDWVYHRLLGAAALGTEFTSTEEDHLEMLIDGPHSIYVSQGKCIKAIIAGDETGFREIFHSWCDGVAVRVPNEQALEEADNDESQASVLIRQLDDSVFFSGLAIIRLATRMNVQTDGLQLEECGLEQLRREAW